MGDSSFWHLWSSWTFALSSCVYGLTKHFSTLFINVSAAKVPRCTGVYQCPFMDISWAPIHHPGAQTRVLLPWQQL